MRKLKEILSIPDSEIREDDHPNRPDITEEEFLAAARESQDRLKKKRPKKKPTPEEWEKRGDKILQAMNSSTEDY